MVWIPDIHEHSATCTHRALKLVRCEHCQTEFYYLMVRSASGASYTFHGIDGEVAQAGAQGAAEEEVMRQLREDCDPVPCPKCGKYQKGMLAVLRKAVGSELIHWGWRLTGVPMPITILGALIMQGENYFGIGVVFLSLGLVTCVIGLTLVLSGRQRRAAFDPYATPLDERLRLAGERAELKEELERRGHPMLDKERIKQALYQRFRPYLTHLYPDPGQLDDPDAPYRAIRRRIEGMVAGEPLPFTAQEKAQLADEIMALAFPNRTTP